MRKNYFPAAVFAVLSAFSMDYGHPDAQEIDPVLKFYVSYADSTISRTLLTIQPVKYSFEAFTYYKTIGRGGVTESIDSSKTRYFCTGPVVDSLKLLMEPHRKIPPITFEFPNVFITAYQHGFFPNDIGERELAISFAPDSDSTDLPDGIAIVDREEFTLIELYLYFPEPEGYKRLTRSFRFTDFSGYVFPDSIWEVGAKQGVFTADYFRLETKINKIQLLR